MIQLSTFVRLIRHIGMPVGFMLLLFSCSERLPEGVVSRERMADILFDVHVADGLLSTRPIDSARKEMVGLYQAIFERHGIDSTVLRQNVEYYTGQPDVMKMMYTQIETRMNEILEAEQNAINEHYRLQRVSDSLRTARTSDSLRRVERLQRDAVRKRHLLFLHKADTTLDASVPVTFESLRERLYEEIRLDTNYTGTLHRWMETPADTMIMTEPLLADPMSADDGSTATPSPGVSPPSKPLTPRKLQLEEAS